MLGPDPRLMEKEFTVLRSHKRRETQLYTDRRATLQISRGHLIFYEFHFYFDNVLDTIATFILKKSI